MLLVSIAGTAIRFAMLGLANSLWMLFLSRILDGFLGGNISLAQPYITDVTDEKERTKGLGLYAERVVFAGRRDPYSGQRWRAGGRQQQRSDKVGCA